MYVLYGSAHEERAEHQDELVVQVVVGEGALKRLSGSVSSSELDSANESSEQIEEVLQMEGARERDRREGVVAEGPRLTLFHG